MESDTANITDNFDSTSYPSPIFSEAENIEVDEVSGLENLNENDFHGNNITNIYIETFTKSYLT